MIGKGVLCLYKHKIQLTLWRSSVISNVVKLFLSFTVFLFSWSPPLVLHRFSLLLPIHLYYNSSWTLCIKCWDSAFRTEFQHFILRFNKISSYFTDTTKRRVRGWKEAQREGEYLWISVICEDFVSFALTEQGTHPSLVLSPKV